MNGTTRKINVRFLGLCIALCFICVGCSSTNLNGFRTEWTGGWIKMNPMDSQTPGKMELGMGYGSVTIVPMARGQGARFTGITYELFSGHPLFAEEILVYPVGQDSILKLTEEPQSVIKIPYLLDIKADTSSGVVNPKKIEIVPIKEK